MFNEIVAEITRIKRQNVQERKDLRVEMNLPVRLASDNSGEVEGQLANLNIGGCDSRRHGFGQRRSDRMLVGRYRLAITDHGSGYAH